MSEKPKFRIMRQGYDRFEVDKAIQELYGTQKSLEEQLVLYHNQIETLSAQKDTLDKRHAHLLSEIQVREKAAEEMARLSLKEANTIIDTAYGNADIIVREAMSTARQLLVEVSRISLESHELRDELTQKIYKLQNTLRGLEFPEIPNEVLIGKDQDKTQR